MDTLKKIEAAIKDMSGQNEIVNWLIENITTKEMAEGLVNAIFERDKANNSTIIRITQSEFDEHFRIIGFRQDGKRETRGRKPKVREA